MRAVPAVLAGWACAACVSVPFDAPPGPGAGGGRVRVEPARMEASQEVRLRFTYAPGPAGLVQGGGFGVRLPEDPSHPHMGFTPPNTGPRHKRGYIRCLVERPEGREDPPPPFAAAPGGGWAQCLVSSGTLGPEDRLVLEYWGLAPRVAGEFTLPAASRVTGGRGALPVGDGVQVSIAARPARALEAILPSEALPGERVTLALVALDEFGNRARDYAATVRVGFGDLVLEHEILAPERGVTSLEVHAPSRPGFVWATVAERHVPEPLALRARSNPMRVVDPGESDGSAQGRILWGDPLARVRTEEPPRVALRYAREVARLDFAGIVADPAASGAAGSWARCGEAVRIEAARDGLIPLAGFAWNDVVILTADPGMPPLRPDRRWTDEPSELLARLEAGPMAGSLAVTGPGAGSWGRAAALEIYSWRNRDLLLQDHPRMFEPGDASVPAPACFVGASSGAWGRPGLVGRTGLEPGAGGLTAVRTRARDARDLLEALREGETWATTGPRIYLDARARGSRIALAAAGTAPLRSVAMMVVSPEGRQRVELLGAPADEHVTTVEEPRPGPGGYYWFHAVQEDGNMAWSGPLAGQTPRAAGGGS